MTFDLECHPSERAMGDLEWPGTTSATWKRRAIEGVVGFNLDGSHMEWQNVSVVQFIREYGHVIHCAHIKGCPGYSRARCAAGLLGGHRPMGHKYNGWNFVTAGTQRTCRSVSKKS